MVRFWWQQDRSRLQNCWNDCVLTINPQIVSELWFIYWGWFWMVLIDVLYWSRVWVVLIMHLCCFNDMIWLKCLWFFACNINSARILFLRGHSFFSTPPQRLMNPGEGFLYQILSITLFSYLNSWERAIFITSLVWPGPWLGIKPGTTRTRCQHSTTMLKCSYRGGGWGSYWYKNTFILCTQGGEAHMVIDPLLLLFQDRWLMLQI